MKSALNLNNDGTISFTDAYYAIAVCLLLLGGMGGGYAIKDFPDEYTDFFLTLPGQVLVVGSVAVGVQGLTRMKWDRVLLLVVFLVSVLRFVRHVIL